MFSNTALYAPLSYLPCLAVSAVHKWLPVQFEFYLMRFLNLVAYVVLGYFVIKKMPVARSAVSVILLLPMSLSLGAAVTSDVMVIMCNFLWVAMLLDFAFKKEKVTKFNILWLFVLAGILAICKNYFFLIFLITLIPSNKYESKKSYYFTVIGVILFALTLSVWWGLRIKGLIIPLNPVANQFEQLNLILQNPVSYAWIFVKSLLIKLPRIIITMIGVLGWQDTRLDFVTYAIIPVLFVCSIFCSNDEGCELKKWQIILLSCVFSLSFFCVATFMYLSWSAVGASIIMGLNGKYFLPIMSVFAVFTSSLVRNKLDLSSEKKLKALNYLIITACLFSSVLSVLHRFYGLTPNLYYSV